MNHWARGWSRFKYTHPGAVYMVALRRAGPISVRLVYVYGRGF